MRSASLVVLAILATVHAENVAKEWWMELPKVEPVSAPEKAADYRPVVLMHGLGDSGSNSGMQSLAKSVEAKYPGIYATSLDVADSTASYFTLIGDQVDEFAAAVRKDPKLAKGFNAVGFSQGGPIVLGYIMRYNDPPVHNFVSICGPVNGVGECPKSIPSWICSFFKAGPYTAKLSFAGYWKEAADEATYLKESTYLADILNERAQKNATYKEHLTSLNNYALVKALQDTVVYPHESEQHGFWAWGDKTHSQVVPMNETAGYKEDWIGLKTLDTSNRLFLHEFDGDHLRFSNQFWDSTVLPYFNNTLTGSIAASAMG